MTVWPIKANEYTVLLALLWLSKGKSAVFELPNNVRAHF